MSATLIVGSMPEGIVLRYARLEELRFIVPQPTLYATSWMTPPASLIFFSASALT
jgi:hypothetical protein